MKPENIAFVEKQLGHTFKKKDLLVRAMTRKAFALEQKQKGQRCEDQEIYRTLGDAILKSILVEMLIENGYDSCKAITEEKANLEKCENLANMIENMGIAYDMRYTKGEEKIYIYDQPLALAETFEALIAAVYYDNGNYEATKEFVIGLFKPVLEKLITDRTKSLDKA
ncbi:RNase III domain-containing protein [Tumidithrix helvetica PCC 7403]|uniref:ribonuclease III domain-containing protein n=1 Tax=Tumidithrix helvetica TaxID=3457545 RepID=UPI003C9B75E2